MLKQSGAGTMLGFEDPDSRAFYDTIGKINLRSPFGGTVANPAKWRDNILPAGIIGVKGNSCRLICCILLGKNDPVTERCGRIKDNENPLG